MGGPVDLTPYIGLPCAYCGIKMTSNKRVEGIPCRNDMATRDHALYPRSWKEKNHGPRPRHNFLVCCRRCNMAKGDSTLGGWLARLQRHKDPRRHRVTEALSQLNTLNRWANGHFTSPDDRADPAIDDQSAGPELYPGPAERHGGGTAADQRPGAAPAGV